MIKSRELYSRLAPWIEVTATGCWEKIGSRNDRGYGQLQFAGKPRKVHQLTFVDTYGPVPPGLEIDHLCRNRACCRPDHLEAVTHLENMQRGASKRRTHCPSGHPYDDKNTRWAAFGGKRPWQQCRECHRLYNLERGRRLRREAKGRRRLP